MNLENERIPSSVNAPDSYHKEFESRLLQRLGISPEAIVPLANLDNNETVLNVETAPVSMIQNELPVAELNPIKPQVEAQKIARKQDPETIKSEAVRKEIEEIGDINIEPMVVSTNENPEWVNFAASDSEKGTSVEGIVKKSTSTTTSDNFISNKVDDTQSSINSSNNSVGDSDLESTTVTEVPAWNDIVSMSENDHLINANAGLEMDEIVVDSEAGIQSGTRINSADSVSPIVVHHVPESLIPEISPFESAGKLDDVPTESKLYNQAEPGLDTLEPPPAPFAPIAGRVQNTTNSPGWIGIAASLAAIVAAYFIWVAIQPETAEQAPVAVIAPEVLTTTPAVVATPKDSVPAGIRLVENLILDEKLEKYNEPNVFSVDQLEDLPEKSKKALNDLEHHNIAVFDMEDVLFEDLDLLIQ